MIYIMNSCSAAERFFSELVNNNKKVAFLGTGVSHRECIKLFASKGIDVTLCDKRTRKQLGEEICGEMDALGVKLKLGENYLHDIDADIIFRTPGIRFFISELNELRRQGKVVTSELEVFFELCPCKKIAVTGSDGKTTTTTLISEILKANGKTVHLGGNIGRALLPIIETVQPDDFAVVELSSFQLISMRQSPDIAVVTNLAPNHLDMHKDMQEYIDAKKNIYQHQNAFSKTILNLDNEITRSMADECRGDVRYFTRQQVPYNGSFLNENNVLCMSDHGKVTEVVKAEDIRIPGIHNVENFLTAIAAVWGLASVESIADIARNFGGVEHRIEFVREKDGVKWYNDSIASSPTRTIAGLKSFNQKIIVIAGGYDKKIPYEPLAPYLIEKSKCVVLMGATAPKIEAAVKNHPDYKEGHPKFLYADSMEDAVKKAQDEAVEGDIVSLSPASASFDLYRNFEERGRHFKNIVNNL